MSNLKFGWSEISITPDKKVSLAGQFAERISEYVEKPVTATAMAVEAGIMGYEMMLSGHQFYDGDGIITKGVENTIRNVGRLARDGMSGTDREIIRMMLGEA